MKHKYNVGDKVYIRECTDTVYDMLQYVGTVATITTVTSGNWDTVYFAYHIKEDGKGWFWREDWLDPIESEIIIDENDFTLLFEKE